ncbi:TonB-dependent receptor [Piscinibacter terrae]|uniref:TonB-dependent receptor n=1 Tax=Piscinibacter terrae TaxID=2496871 RepID=A0A3N7IQN4_9BURK|nr:TonB-dependent receptor [Albitalea terrae]RQP21202.1 TonB-dependent receptor [Albitalea terrae]
MNLRPHPIAAAAAIVVLNTMFAAQAQQEPATPDAKPAESKPAEAKTPQKLETVTVTGIRASREASINQKRNADSIVEVITAEDIGKLPDKNVADAVQRIPGVNISSGAGGEGGFSENDRVSIRGTSASLTQTLINGHAVGTGDWFVLNQTEAVGRSVSYSLLPSEIVSKVTVYKSAQADLVEGGVAGAVNIETRSPLSFKKPFTAEVSAQMIHSTLAKKTDPQLNALFNWKNDAGNGGVLFQIFSETRHERRDGQEFLGYAQIDPASAAATANPALANVWYPQLINSSLFTQKRVRNGGVLDVEFKPNNALTLDANAFFSHMSAVNFDHSYLANPQALFDSGDVPTNTIVRNNTLVQADFANAHGAAPGLVDSIARPGAASESWYVDFNGKYRLSDKVFVTAKLGTTRGLGNTPGDLGYESNLPTTGGLSYSMHGIGSPTKVAFPGIDTADYHAADLAGAWWAVVKVVDKETYAQADAEVQMDGGLIESTKFGVRFAEHHRQVHYPNNGGCGFGGPNPCGATANWDGALYPSNFGSGFGAGPGLLPPMWIQNQQTIEDFIHTHGVTTSEYWPGQFSVNEKTMAGYAMANLAGDSWRGNVGLRLVKTKQRVNYNVPGDTIPSTDFPPGYTPITDERSYNDALPSANLRYELTKNLVTRASVARTMTRVDYSALAGAITSLDNITLSGTGGNVNLKPVRSTNYDATLEWYFAPRSLLSFGVFFMDMSSYVGYGTSKQMLPNTNHAGAIEEYTITAPINVKAKNKGFEIGYQQALPAGFGMSANYTYARGHDSDGQALVGSSKNTYNLEGFYENETFSARLAYTYRSDYLVGLDRATTQYEAGSGNLAATVQYKLNDRFSLQFDALNLNNPVLKYYGDNKDQPRAFYSNGRQFFFGVRASL